jgi:hypothetical protein
MPRPARPIGRLVPLAANASAVLVLAACGTAAGSRPAPVSKPAPPAGATGSSSAVAAVGKPAPAGGFATLAGTNIDVTSFLGKPMLVWFIATECSSCTASIPALADHLKDLKADGGQAAVIDLYGDLGRGSKAGGQLTKLGRKLAGKRFSEPAWTWGISSRALSFRYDQYGAPDIYYIVDRTWKITYRNGVPVSTMTQLLEHAHAAAQT